MPIHYETIPGDARLTETRKVTTGYFPGGIGTAVSGSMLTASLGSTQNKYYINLQYSSKDVFSVGYGHTAGSGSDTAGGTMPGSTEAQYKQMSNLCLLREEQEIGWRFTGSNALTNRSDDIYFIVAERAQMKDRINKANWTVMLSGSHWNKGMNTAAASTSASKVYLTDDSKTVTGVATPGGMRFNVVSGSLGTVTKAATQRRYGYIYPDLGLLILNPTALSSSAGHSDALNIYQGEGVVINGSPGYVNTGSNTPKSHLGNGLTPDSRITSTADGTNAYKLAAAIQKGYVTMRAEEDVTTNSYFCRAKANDFNFSNNYSYTTGSDNEIIQASFEGNPQTYITTIGLYNDSHELLAVGRLSKPILKNYGTEATFKANLTY